jgi:hypothetical protein
MRKGDRHPSQIRQQETAVSKAQLSGEFLMASPRPDYLKSWFLFFLVATVNGTIAGGLLGGAVMGASGVALQHIVLISKITSFVVGIPVSFFTFRWSVRTYIVDPMMLRAAEPPPYELCRLGSRAVHPNIGE